MYIWQALGVDTDLLAQLIGLTVTAKQPRGSKWNNGE